MSDTEEATNAALSDPLAVVNAAAGPVTASGTVETSSLSNAAARLEDLWDEIVGRWLAGVIHNSPVAQSTDAYNHLLASLPALRQAISEKL